MQCTCGGTFQRRTGMGKFGPYDFWGCDNFRAGCQNSLKPVEYERLQQGGDTVLPESMKKEKKQWAKPNHKQYRPPQRSNKNRAAVVDYRQMTNEQEAIMLRLQQGGRVRMRIKAGAGTGKSSVSRQAAARIKPVKGEYTTGILLSFGKRAAAEQVLPFNWVSGTVHSSGNDAVAAYFGVDKWKPNEFKTKHILRDQYGVAEQPERQALYSAAESIVDMCKALALPSTVDDETLMYYANLYNTNVGESPAETFTYARTVLNIGSSKQGIINYGHDYNDMVYLPVILNLPVAKYRYVGVDEFQDSSPARMLLAQMMCLENLFVVGDEHQNIFGFTYAAINAMDDILDLMGPTSEDFPLTMNWRCPSDVIRMANLFDESLRARPNAPKGGIHEISDEQFYRIVQPGDLVLCRVNADLIHAAYELIKLGIGAVVLGRDIGKNLQNIIIRLGKAPDGSYLHTIKFIERLNQWYESEYEVTSAKNVRNVERLLQKLDDDYNCILALCGVEIEEGELTGVEITSVAGVLAKIDQMFGEETDAGFDPMRVVTLATIHKMKGGQCRRVFDLRSHENHPHPMAVSEWEIQQEIWVFFVALTRTGDGTDDEGQAFFFVGGMPAMVEQRGGRAFLTPYTGVIR